ncbi:MAG TPA: cyclic nucleotide-binding domain-containing protein, partial [Vicinamibacterales bacterium]|nr:cyclic nucleotide-binding domain-containing protein [Vicinamibacterales bacterium]
MHSTSQHVRGGGQNIADPRRGLFDPGYPIHCGFLRRRDFVAICASNAPRPISVPWTGEPVTSSSPYNRSGRMAATRRTTSQSKVRRGFDVEAYLESTGPARQTVKYRRGEVVFSQGDPAGDVRYIQTGAIKLAVLSRNGKEAVVAMLGPGDFFGEGALAGQSIRIST